MAKNTECKTILGLNNSRINLLGTNVMNWRHYIKMTWKIIVSMRITATDNRSDGTFEEASRDHKL